MAASHPQHHSRGSKRKRGPAHKDDGSKKQRKNKQTPTKAAGGDKCCFQWLDEGTARPDGSRVHSSVMMRRDDDEENNATSFVLFQGDTVILAQEKQATEDDDQQQDYGSKKKKKKKKQNHPSPLTSQVSVARIELMWQEPPAAEAGGSESGSPKLRLRWFLKKDDLEALDRRMPFQAPMDLQTLLDSLTVRDVVLSNQMDDNDLKSIAGPCQVIYRRPTNPDGAPSEAFLASECLLCQYSMDFGGNNNDGHQAMVVLTPYAGENDDWDLAARPPQSDENHKQRQQPSSSNNNNKKKTAKPQEGKRAGTASPPATTNSATAAAETQAATSSEDNATSSSSCADQEPQEITASAPDWAEGSSTMKGSIRVGEDHQVSVPKLDPSSKTPPRGCVLVWTKDAIANEALELFLENAGTILTEYMARHGLVRTEPYSPLPAERMEAMLLEGGTMTPPTLSSVCTASSLCTTNHKNKLPRECNVEALLRTLSSKNYDTKTALECVQADPSKYLSIWNEWERDQFDAGFHRYAGSLRMTTKVLLSATEGTHKDFHDVIDYHYRFKIPDNFRRFRDKKRLEAIRIMESIETRRHYYDSIAFDRRPSASHSPRLADAPSNSLWSRTASADVIGAVDERRVNAKTLLQTARTAVGKQTMIEIAQEIKKLEKGGSVLALKDFLLEKLKDHPELTEHFLEFLPIELRG